MTRTAIYDDFGTCEVKFCRRTAVTEIDDLQLCRFHERQLEINDGLEEE